MNQFRSLIAAAIAIIGLWLFSSSQIRGDLNSLFSGLAFVAILLSIYQQGRELKQARLQQELDTSAQLLNFYQAMLDHNRQQRAKRVVISSDTTEFDDAIAYAKKKIDDYEKHIAEIRKLIEKLK